MLLRVLEISKVFVCILICMYIMLCSIISVRQQPNVALYVIRANKDILYCIVLYPFFLLAGKLVLCFNLR